MEKSCLLEKPIKTKLPLTLVKEVANYNLRFRLLNQV